MDIYSYSRPHARRDLERRVAALEAEVSRLRFTASGTHEPKVVAGGPRPAAYSGTVSGRRLALNVEVEQTAIGPFELQQGQKGTFEPCNF